MTRRVGAGLAVLTMTIGGTILASGERTGAVDPRVLGCGSSADFVSIPEQGPSCRIPGGFLVRHPDGSLIATHGPDNAADLASSAHALRAAAVPASASAPPAAQPPITCVAASQKHIELVYSHFADGPDNFAALAPDIVSQFRDVDANTMNYDAYHYFGHYIHLPVLCNPDGTPKVQDVPISTARTASTYDSITADLSTAGLKSTTAHYWDYTDGNPSSTGVAGQGGYWCGSTSANCPDDSPGPGNNGNSGPQYALNYGFTEIPSSGTVTTGADVFAHENGHTMGTVPLSAPHTTGAAHCTDGLDVMCYDDKGPSGSSYNASICANAPNGRAIFDCNFNDYFNFNPGGAPYPNTYLSTHRNLGGPDNVWVTRSSINSPADANGDLMTDETIYRPSTGTWYTSYSGPSPYSATTWGQSGDIPVPGDYLHEGQAQDAIFRPSTGDWFIKSTGSSSYQVTRWGQSGDIPVPGDYDGTGIADLAVFRPSTGAWFIRHLDGSYTATTWGQSGDIPVPGDYEGANASDIAIFRPSTGTWFIRHINGTYVATVWGQSGDVPVPGDYEGTGRKNIAIFRQSTGTWYVLKQAGGYTATVWGQNGDIPQPGDYNGDGKTDVTIYRPGASGTWYVLPSGGGSYTATAWGSTGDVPTTLPASIRQAFPFS